MPGPLHSQAPALFWFYRLVGLGAVVGAVWLGRNRSGLGGLGATKTPPDDSSLFCPWAREAFGPVLDFQASEGLVRRNRMVRSTEPLREDGGEVIPAGTLMKADHVECSRGDGEAIVFLSVEMMEPLFTSANVVTKSVRVHIRKNYIPFRFVDDDDTSPAFVQSARRHASPPQRGWAKQLRQSRRRP